MVTLGEVLNLGTTRGGTMVSAEWGSFDFFWVSRSVENAFATIAHLKMLRDIDMYTKPQPRVHFLLYRYLYMLFCYQILRGILVTRNSIPSKLDFPWSHLHIEIIKISCYNCCGFTFKKMSFYEFTF